MKIRWLALLLFLSSSLLPAAESRVYFGTYTKAGGSQGIYTAVFDDETGKLGEAVLAVEAENPSFLAMSPGGGELYAVSEVGGATGGKVMAYRILPTGALEKINEQSSTGDGPCHVAIAALGRVLALANYGGGSVASYLIGEDGALSAPVSAIQHTGSSVDPKRQKEPHAHSIHFFPSIGNTATNSVLAYAMDLGTDRIYRYAVDRKTGAMTRAGETAVKPGSGPRHFAIRPDGKFAYVINEMALSVTAFSVAAFSVEGAGDLEAIQTIPTLPTGTAPTGSTAEVVCHPTGRFLYGSNRGHDTIVVYTIDEATGKLTWVENEPIRGKTPRNFVVSPDGKWLLAAGQQSDSVAVFAIDAKTGELDYAGSEIKVSSPVCIRFRPKW